MMTRAGVWIDHENAIVVALTNADPEFKKFRTRATSPDSNEGGEREQHDYSPNDFIPEDRRERKLENERKEMHKEVLAYLGDVDSLLIIGPGEAKVEFRKYLTAKGKRGIVVEIETSDKMTDRQLIAKVLEHFNVSPARKSVIPGQSPKARTNKKEKKSEI